jgi:hypothetical protein
MVRRVYSSERPREYRTCHCGASNFLRHTAYASAPSRTSANCKTFFKTSGSSTDDTRLEVASSNVLMAGSTAGNPIAATQIIRPTNSGLIGPAQSSGTKTRQTGEGTVAPSSVFVNFPVFSSIVYSTMLLLFWLAASRRFPVGSIVKCRGSFPNVEICPTKVSLPLC